MGIFAICMLCFSSLVIGVTTSAYAFLPDKYPANWWYILGWVFFMASICLWETRK